MVEKVQAFSSFPTHLALKHQPQYNCITIFSSNLIMKNLLKIQLVAKISTHGEKHKLYTIHQNIL